MPRVTKQELTIAKNDANYWRSQWNAEISRQHKTNLELSEAKLKIASLQKELAEARQKHAQEQLSVIKNAARAYEEQSAHYQNAINLRTTEAERDAVGKCFQYLADTMADAKVAITEGK